MESELAGFVTTLTSLYRQEAANPASEYIQQRISDVRTDVRSTITEILDEEITRIITEPTTDGTTPDSLVRQQSAITLLTEQRRNDEVDLEILNTEREAFYGASTGAGLDPSLRQTASLPELQAKVAVLEERIAAIDPILTVQEDRLNRLQADQWWQNFSAFFGIGKQLAVVFGILLIAYLLRHLIFERISDQDRRYRATKAVSSLAYLAIFVWLLMTTLTTYPGALASVAIVGAGLIIALQDVVKDMIGWLMIVQGKFYKRGDRIGIGLMTGDVINVGFLRTTVLEVGTQLSLDQTIRERTGKTLLVPNSSVLNQQIMNHSLTSNFVRAEMKLIVTFESDWRKAKKLLEEIMEKHTGKYVVQEAKQKEYKARMLFLPQQTSGNQVFYDIVANGVELTMRFTVPIGERRPIVSAISEDILDSLLVETDVELAYNTVRQIPTPDK